MLRVADPSDAANLTRDIHTALEGRRFAAIVVDKMQPWFEDDLTRYYKNTRSVSDDDALWTRTGYRTRPRWIYVPR